MNILPLFCKSFSLSIIIIVTFIHVRGGLAGNGIIGIYGASHSYEVEYNITKCNPEVNNTIDGQVSQISANGNCVNLFQEHNCQGHFVRYVGRDSYSLHTPGRYKWMDDGTLVKEPLLVHSVGPCFDRCDPRNWEGAGGTSPTVTLYEDTEFRGRETIVHLNSDDCYAVQIPARRDWDSLKISGNEFSSCVELHKEVNCGGDFTQFQPGYPNLQNLGDWSFGGEYPAYHVKAVSRCGAFCGKTVSPIKAAPLENPGPGVVTYYSNFGYYGNGRNVNLTDGCVELDLNKDDTRSVRTYGQCVIFYGLPACEEKQGYNTLQLGGEMGKDYYIEKFLTLTVPAPPQSLGLCPSVQSVDKVMTQGPPTTAQSETNQNWSEKVEILEKMLAKAENKGFPDWIIYVQPFCWLLFFVGGALVGVIILKRREKNRHGANSEGFNVAYKSAS